MLKDMRHSWCLHRLKHPIIQPWGKRPILSISQPLFYFSYCFPLNSLTSYCIILCSAIYLHWVHRTLRWVPRGSLLNERQHVLPLSVWQSARWRELRPPLLISTLDPLHASRRVEEVKRSLTDNVNEQEDYGDDLSLKSAHPPIMLPALHPSSSTVVAGNPTPWTGGLHYVGQPDNFRTFKSKLFFLWKMCGATTWYWGLHPSIHPSIHPQSHYLLSNYCEATILINLQSRQKQYACCYWKSSLYVFQADISEQILQDLVRGSGRMRLQLQSLAQWLW